MATFRVIMTYEREVEWFVDAEKAEDVDAFLETNPQFEPGDVPGLIDHVSDEEETGFLIADEPKITAGFEIVAGKFREKDQ